MGSVNTKRCASKFKYISGSKFDSCYYVTMPLKRNSTVCFGYSKSLRKVWAIRNRVGKRIWGEYWGAVLAGFVDSVKSETTSVHIRFRSGAWVVHYRTLKEGKQKSKSFSCKKYGDQEAKSLAREHASKLAQERLEQLKNWNPRILRTTRPS